MAGIVSVGDPWDDGASSLKIVRLDLAAVPHDSGGERVLRVFGT
jgi:hypothetical protein